MRTKVAEWLILLTIMGWITAFFEIYNMTSLQNDIESSIEMHMNGSRSTNANGEKILGQERQELKRIANSILVAKLFTYCIIPIIFIILIFLYRRSTRIEASSQTGTS